jgi:hypothetical protein
MNSKKNKLLIIFLFFSISTLLGQGYNNKRFVFSYNPAYSIIVTDMILISPYFIHHHKLELGLSLGKRIFLSTNVEYSTNLSKTNALYEVKDNTYGGTLYFFKNKKGSFTPIGKFIGFGVNAGAANGLVKDTVDTDYGSEIYTSIQRDPVVIFSLYTGQNYILYDRLFLGYGVQWGVEYYKVNQQQLRNFGKAYFKIGLTF